MISDICVKLSGLLEIVGNVLKLFFLGIPLVIVVYVIFDFYKAVTSNEEKILGKVTKRALLRLVAGVLIFFIPSIVSFIFSAVGLDESPCLKCVLDTKTCSDIKSENEVNPDQKDNLEESNYCDVEDESCVSKAIYIG